MYDAFISYRHAPLDMYIAERLHTMLEHFRLPMLADKSALEKTKIERVFRDRDELPVSDDLSESISEALANSAYLVVICSTSTPESKWVEKEIEQFAQMHGRDKILAVLIEGEPEESFPYILCHDKDPVTGEEIVVEPLAADIRAVSRKKSVAILKKEILRLVAPMLSCKYDDLKQRHKEYRLKRTAIITFAISLFLLLAGSFSTVQAVRISRQAKEINRLFATEEASKANTLYDEGKRNDAVNAAVDAIDRLSDKDAIPAVNSALAKVLRVYDTGMYRDPWCQYKTQGLITAADMSADNKYIAAVDEVGNISVWDALSGDNVFNYKMRCDSTSLGVLEDGLKFVDDSTFVFIGANERGCINVQSGQVNSTKSDFFGRTYAFSDNLKYCIISDGMDLQVFSTDTMEEVFTLADATYAEEDDTLSSTRGIVGGLAVSDNGKYVSFGNMGKEDMPGAVHVFDTETKKEVFGQALEYDFPKHAHISNNGYGMIVSKYTGMRGSFLSASDEMILFYDNTGKAVNKQEFYGTVSAKPEVKNGKYIVSADTKLLIFDEGTGEKIADMDLSSKVKAVTLTDSDFIPCYVSREDGGIDLLLTKEDGSYELSSLVTGGSRTVLATIPSKDGDAYLSVPGKSNEAYLYVRKTSEVLEEVCTVGTNITGVIMNQENDSLAVNSMSSGTITVCDIGNGEEEATSENVVLEATVYENDQLVDASNGKNYIAMGFSDITVYDWDSKAKVASVDNEYAVSSYYCKSNQTVYISDTFDIKAYALPDMKEVKTIPIEMVENFIVFNSGNTMAYLDYYGECHVMQIESGEDVVLPHSSGLMIVAPDDKNFVINDKSDNMFRAYNAEGEEVASCENSALLVKSFGFSENGDYLFVTYSNGKFDVMQASDFQLVASCDDIDASITRMKKIEKLDKYVLLSKEWYGEEGYVLSSDFKVEARIDKLFDMTKDGRVICGSSGVLYTAPYLNGEALRELVD